MSYKYITDNNLYEKQTYMYSEYCGKSFLNDYLSSRQGYLQDIVEEWCENDAVCTFKCATEENLKVILSRLKKETEETDTCSLINLYTKSFEVRKRLYTEYDARWKPAENAQFEVYEIYLLFADCLIRAYRRTGCLKYLSCLMKVNDTVLSISDKLASELRPYMAWIVNAELEAFFELSDKIGIGLEGGT